MFKRAKYVKITIEGKTIESYQAPESIDEMDGRCPDCGSSEYHHLFTVVQLGFIDDECCSFLKCGDCWQTFHYWYLVDASQVDIPDRVSDTADRRLE